MVVVPDRISPARRDVLTSERRAGKLIDFGEVPHVERLAPGFG